MSHLPACTVASNNYLAMASVFADSYREHHPGAEVFCCVVDRPSAEVDYEALPFRVIFAEELGVPAFRNLAFRYDLLELNTAVKPFLLARLRDRHGVASVLYFDPDILVTDRLQGIEAAMAGHVAVLTPHITAPLDNDFNPSERKIRMLGIYNLGFLGLRLDASTAEFLSWWQDRLYLYGQDDPFNGVFVDQGWMDFAPAFLEPVAVLRDPIYNVAYWNLPQRHPQPGVGGWVIDGRRVGFFHFSGARLDDLSTLSKHQDRLAFAERPELRPLLEHYQGLVVARGHERFRDLPYSYGSFEAVGEPIPLVLRRALQQVDPWGRRWADPFAGGDDDSFLHWLTEPLRCSGGAINRALLSLWEQRPELVREFREVCGADLARYLRWLTSEGGARREGLSQRFLAGLGAGGGGSAAASTQRRPERRPAEAGGWDHAAETLSGIDLRRPGAMAAWLNDPVPGSASARPRITRLALLLYHNRPDVQEAYPDPLGRDQSAFADWFCRSAAAELELASALVEPVLTTLPLRTRVGLGLRRLRGRDRADGRAAAPPVGLGLPPATQPPAASEPAPAADLHGAGGRRPAPGVNLACFAARSPLPQRLMAGFARAAVAEGVPHVSLALHADMWGKLVGGRMQQPPGTPYPLTVLFCRPSDTVTALSRMPFAATAGGYVIAYWSWDLAHAPVELHRQFGGVNEVWVPSQLCARSLSPLADIPLRRVPPHVPTPVGEAADRRQLGLGETPFLLLTVCDVGDGFRRSNPGAAIELVRRLVEDGHRQIGLVLLLERAEGDRAAAAELRELAGGLPVVVVDEAVTDDHRDRLLLGCDALLSLHRAEAFNTATAAAMLLAKPVVATAAGGMLDVLDDSTGYPVESTPLRLDEDFGPYPKGSVWAGPSLSSAHDQLVAILENPGEARRRAIAAAARARELYGLDAVRRRLAAELARTARYGASPGRGEEHGADGAER